MYPNPVISGANVFALSHARVTWFDKTIRIIEGSVKGQNRRRSDKIIQNILTLTQYPGADKQKYKLKNNQLQKKNQLEQDKISFSQAVLI